MSVGLVDAGPQTERRAVRGATATDRIIVTEGVALAVLVGFDGPGPWPAMRALVVICVAAAVLWARRSPVRRRANSAVLALGLVGLIAGVGIGVPHAVKAGVSAQSVSGIAALAAGLALVGIATVVQVRGVRGWRKLLAAPIGVGVAVLVVAPLALAVAVTNVPSLDLGDETPADHGMAIFGRVDPGERRRITRGLVRPVDQRRRDRAAGRRHEHSHRRAAPCLRARPPRLRRAAPRRSRPRQQWR